MAQGPFLSSLQQLLVAPSLAWAWLMICVASPRHAAGQRRSQNLKRSYPTSGVLRPAGSVGHLPALVHYGVSRIASPERPHRFIDFVSLRVFTEMEREVV
jgi:hypothetical protein